MRGRLKGRGARAVFEALEPRGLMATGFTGFASIPVAAPPVPGGVSAVTFRITGSDFTTGRSGSVWLRVDDGDGPALGAVTYAATTRKGLVTRDATVLPLAGNEELVKVRQGTYTMTVGPIGLNAPAASVGFALAGDATGSDAVTFASLAAVRGAIGQRQGSAGYLPAADVNGDGVINRVDLRLARANLGASTSVRPLAPAVDTVLTPTSPLLVDRTVVVTTTPGATVALTPESGTSTGGGAPPTVTGTADATGAVRFETANFLTGPGGAEDLGSFTASVQVADAFGQYTTGSFPVRDALNEGLGYIATGEAPYDPANGPPASESAGVLPASIDLTTTGFAPPTFNQGPIGSCTANAVAWDYAYVANMEGLATSTPSRAFLYYNARVVNGKNPATFTSNDGLNVTAAVRAAETVGMAPETLWPYQTQTINAAPPASAYAAAASHKVLAAYQIDDSSIKQIEGSLAAGFPVVFAVKLTQDFQSEAVEDTGQIPLPQVTDQTAGGHAMVIVGYNNATRQFEFVNSWGDQWGAANSQGERGYGYIPFNYVVSPNFAYQGSFYSIRSVS